MTEGHYIHANLAQLVEQWFCKPSVRGSSPRVGSGTIDTWVDTKAVNWGGL